MNNKQDEQRRLIVEQFTKQAVPFAEMPIHNGEDTNRLVIETAGIGPEDTVLDVACGPGLITCAVAKIARHVTGIDISQPMLANARGLNPECDFEPADMRSCDLGRTFDAILIDDAVTYMTCRADLAAVFATAGRHLRPGGVMVVSPDETKETFHQNRVRVSEAEASVKPAAVDVVFLENAYAPAPRAATYEGTIVYLLREHGRLRTEVDTHLLGLFALETWRQCLREAGFHVHEEVYADRRADVPTFACVKPL